MSLTCDIEFDNNPYGSYFAGQVLSGRITLNSTKIRQVKGVVLKIRGFADTRWSESTGTGSRKRTQYYYGHEDYIDSLTYLFGSDENQSVNIEAGTHIYSFQCQIPGTCPSSLECHYGRIRYTVQVALIRPWKFDQTFMKGFTVVKFMDLNCDSPLLRVPSNTEAKKTFGFGPFKSGPLLLNLSLSQSGYVPGQDIHVSLLVDNDSKIQIESINAALVMLVRYFSQTQSRSKQQRFVVTKMKGDSVQQYCKKLFNYPLYVPATPPTCLNLCRIVQIAYHVEVEAKVKGLHSNQVVCMPLTIGNVPLHDMSKDKQVNSVDDDDKELDAAHGLQQIEAAKKEPSASNLWSSDLNMPPPAYEEAVHMPHAKINEAEAHDYGQTDFAPRYPVFDVPSSIETTKDIKN